MTDQMPPTQPAIDSERAALVKQLQEWLELPMLVLAFIWLALFLVETIWGLSPFLEAAGLVIWILFALDFALGLSLSPRRLEFVQDNWLKGVALLAPALRVFRVVNLLRLARVSGAARMARGVRLLRILSSTNRGMRALGASMGRRGVGYVVVLTLIVTLVGAAGMYTFENDNPRGVGLNSYGAALWWTAMIMTTMGSDFWPQTGEGRLLCIALALYSFGVFGYVTATLATFFIGRDADDEEAEVAGARSIAALREEIAALRADVRALAK